MAKNVDEVVVHVPQGTKTVTIKIGPVAPVKEEKSKTQRRKICD